MCARFRSLGAASLDACLKLWLARRMPLLTGETDATPTGRAAPRTCTSRLQRRSRRSRPASVWSLSESPYTGCVGSRACARARRTTTPRMRLLDLATEGTALPPPVPALHPRPTSHRQPAGASPGHLSGACHDEPVGTWPRAARAARLSVPARRAAALLPARGGTHGAPTSKTSSPSRGFAALAAVGRVFL